MDETWVLSVYLLFGIKRFVGVSLFICTIEGKLRRLSHLRVKQCVRRPRVSHTHCPPGPGGLRGHCPRTGLPLTPPLPAGRGGCTPAREPRRPGASLPARAAMSVAQQGPGPAAGAPRPPAPRGTDRAPTPMRERGKEGSGGTDPLGPSAHRAAGTGAERPPVLRRRLRAASPGPRTDAFRPTEKSVSEDGRRSLFFCNKNPLCL